MTPAPGETWREAHGQRYGAFCHSAITNTSRPDHVAARDAAKARILDWLFVAAPRVAATGSNATASSVPYGGFSGAFTMGSARASRAVDTAPARHLSGNEMPEPRRYSVVVAKDYLKFAAAHFIAYPGYREPLHGHNYQISVKIEADLGPDGYVLDFGLVKRVAKALCQELDERVLVPERSECLIVARLEDAVEVTTESGARFRFPADDVRLLPIAHSSAEELAAYLLGRLRDALGAEVGGRGLAALEVGVAEAPGQVAYCREEC